MKQDEAQPAKGADANSQLPAGINFVTMQEKAQWRTPKLIGVDVYGADNKKIGKIDDILMGHDGKAQAVVIGVGGFLGIGKKDVGVPFSAIEWKTEPRKVTAKRFGKSALPGVSAKALTESRKGRAMEQPAPFRITRRENAAEGSLERNWEKGQSWRLRVSPPESGVPA